MEYFRRISVKNVFIILFFGVLICWHIGLIYSGLGFNGDIARDQMYAEAIIRSGFSLNVKLGHWNSGLNTSYPPFYYYFLALVRLANNSYESIAIFQIFMNLVSIFGIYKITALLSSKKGGLIAAALSLVSTVTIKMGQIPNSASFSIPFAFISLYWAIKSLIKSENSKLMILSLALCAFMTTIFYGFVFQMVFIFLLIFVLNKNKIKALKLIATGVLFFLFFNIQPVFNFGFLSFIERNTQGLWEFVYAIKPLYNIIFITYFENINLVKITILVIQMLFGIYLIQISSSLNTKKHLVILMVVTYFMALVILTAKLGDYHYGAIQYFLIFILLGVFIENIKFKNKFIITFLLQVFLASYFFYSFFPVEDNYKLFTEQPSNYTLVKEDAAHLESINPYPQEALIISTPVNSNKLDYWQSLSYWYFDYLKNPNNYTFQSKVSCPVEWDSMCFKGIPEVILYKCTGSDGPGGFLVNSELNTCFSRMNKMLEQVGNSYVQLESGSYVIFVNKEKYSNFNGWLLSDQ